MPCQTNSKHAVSMGCCTQLPQRHKIIKVQVAVWGWRQNAFVAGYDNTKLYRVASTVTSLGAENRTVTETIDDDGNVTSSTSTTAGWASADATYSNRYYDDNSWTYTKTSSSVTLRSLSSGDAIGSEIVSVSIVKNCIPARDAMLEQLAGLSLDSLPEPTELFLGYYLTQQVYIYRHAAGDLVLIPDRSFQNGKPSAYYLGRILNYGDYCESAWLLDAIRFPNTNLPLRYAVKQTSGRARMNGACDEFYATKSRSYHNKTACRVTTRDGVSDPLACEPNLGPISYNTTIGRDCTPLVGSLYDKTAVRIYFADETNIPGCCA